VSIHFSQEDKPLGTCGPLSLLRDRLTEPFLLTNGDILTKLDYRQMFDFAMKRRASLCVGTKIITTPFRFGNVTVDSEENIIQVDEKPDFSLEVVAGIYCMKPTIFEFIPSNEYFGMDSLIKKMIAAGVPVARYQIEDYWIDIGQVEDYSRARQVVEENILTPNE
jgi:NDP-sugar pyrophosphorylase family protein